MTQPDWLYHVGHPHDPADSDRRQAQGLPAYRPTDPKPTDQRPYLAFAETRGPNSER